MRIDAYLAEKGIYKSRTRAAEAVKQGCVTVNGKVTLRVSTDVSDNDVIDCGNDPLKYVGRGALKIIKALDYFEIDVAGSVCVDIGASTGGFTEVLLERGAKQVYCVDVGTNQLDASLRNDARVVCCEQTDARTYRPDIRFDFLCMDVSFISASAMTETVRALLSKQGRGVILVKPQFEVGRAYVGKRGVVRDRDVIAAAVSGVCEAYERCGMSVSEPIESPIRGGDGNIEYLIAVACFS